VKRPVLLCLTAICPLITVLIVNGVRGYGKSEIKGSTIFLLTHNKGVFRSVDSGGSWESLNKGLPSDVIPLQCIKSGDNIILSTQKSGLFMLKAGNLSWIDISFPGLRRRSLYTDTSSYRKISAMAVDAFDSRHIVIATKHSMYESNDGGLSWHGKSVGNGFQRHYITALAISNKTIYAGTSYGGLFRVSKDRPVCISDGLPCEYYSNSLKFYEEISSLAISDTGSILVSLAHTDEIYVFSDGKWSLVVAGTHEKGKYHSSVASSSDSILFFNDRVFKMKGKMITGQEADNDISYNVPYPARSFFIISNNNTCYMVETKKNAAEKPDGIRALYAGPPSIRRVEKLCDTAAACGLNGLVIDMKDDEGHVLFPSANKTAREISAVSGKNDISEILKIIHSKNLKAIARIVVFKDRKLFKAQNGFFAIKDRLTGRPWQGTGKEFWVDPTLKEVQAYNIEIACELEKSGFDEIQFDYIRFPSDGDTGRCDFSRMNREGFFTSEIIEDFLKQADKKIKISISADIYGFNAWYRFGNTIGQDMEEMSFIVDSICPMIYPSHFGNRFLHEKDASRRTYRIINESCRRGLRYTENRSAVRPYLQAFRLMSPDWGTGYITSQIQGARDAGADGYIFWNAAGDYDIVREAIVH